MKFENKVSGRAKSQVHTEVQSSVRNEIFEQESMDEEVVKEEAERMDILMRNLIGNADGNEEEEESKEEESNDMETEQAEEFSFRLFASEPVATVTIAEGADNTDDLSKAIADQQVYEFDETDPEFFAKVEQAAIDYDTILTQSKIPYPTATFPRRILHLLSPEEQAKKEAADKKKITKKRKSKKCRDFEKAVKAGKIKADPKMRNPATPDGWPGWPGNLTRIAIINYQPSNKKRDSGARGGFRGRGGSRGGSRGGMMAGRGRGRAF
ncbi:hypothetical protein V8B55DRAFT_1535789 [Mucor lusitanicus]|uniref:Uncharacterized protein n=2 Tax=Mucor circinelloides f. lusitanicus TaxID=29924 RepID=A0A162Q808_MUCCL|nr:hypothetical protein FB192DRAFT_1380874 [Mucor lusitanicus]OAC99709.1 hypothetical protein MUCCIDRAFT_165537 [Mucor lusitanicus CBS 277.49]